MKRIIFFTILYFYIFSGIAQKQHLEPVSLDQNTKSDLYYISLFDKLYEDLSKDNSFRYAVVPSFYPEYGFSVESKKEKYFIISTSLSESYWYSKNKKKVKFSTQKNKIDKELYEQIGKIFKLLEEQTKEYEELNFVTDGVSYYFITTNKDGNNKTGKIWSPSKESTLGKWIFVCDKLYHFKKNKNYNFKKEIGDIISVLEK
ncbi:hypothetical protein [Flavobacterium chungbukense]|nr:hypothetical protein [Flavobacterium chungbukense]MCC4920269.1 hypothetical protein [Flavobacterium chungbukense]